MLLYRMQVSNGWNISYEYVLIKAMCYLMWISLCQRMQVSYVCNTTAVKLSLIHEKNVGKKF